MKKRFAVSTWATLLMILLMMVACGPAVSTEQADEMTRRRAGPSRLKPEPALKNQRRTERLNCRPHRSQWAGHRDRQWFAGHRNAKATALRPRWVIW